MAKIDFNGIGIAYDIIGDGPQTAIITPGGRFSKDTPGVRQLAEKLAEGGIKTVIWDRPNCGESDIAFAGETESVQNADTLAGLLSALGFGKTLVIGGSAGSRVSLIAARRHPEQVAGLFLLWISGGPIGLAVLAVHYCGESARAANMGGMEAVAALPEWQESLERNPGNRDRLLAQEPKAFIATMQRWAASFFPNPGSPVPGLTPADFAALTIPVMVLRSGESDLAHTRATSEQVHALIPGSHLAEPPWGDQEWNERGKARHEGLFARWPLLAPQILDFAKTLAVPA
jgi:pimeloyl-ACP methyl ester carboxylesterase